MVTILKIWVTLLSIVWNIKCFHPFQKVCFLILGKTEYNKVITAATNVFHWTLNYETVAYLSFRVENDGSLLAAEETFSAWPCSLLARRGPLSRSAVSCIPYEQSSGYQVRSSWPHATTSNIPVWPPIIFTTHMWILCWKHFNSLEITVLLFL